MSDDDKFAAILARLDRMALDSAVRAERLERVATSLDSLSDTVAVMQQDIFEIKSAQEASDRTLSDHMVREESAIEKMNEAYYEAFPNKDRRGHHDWHLGVIQTTAERQKIIWLMKTVAITVILTGALGAFGKLLWDGAITRAKQELHEVKKP